MKPLAPPILCAISAPFSAVVSGGVCNELFVGCSCWGVAAEDFAGVVVEFGVGGVDVVVGEGGEVGAFGVVVPDQAVGVLVGAALPG